MISNNEKLKLITKEQLSDAWLNVIIDESKVTNKLKNVPSQFEDTPHLFITYLMSQPEYISTLCKHILNFTCLPIQSVILKEIWNHKFPMLIASRGFGKCETKDSFIQLSDRFCRIGDIIDETYIPHKKYFIDKKIYGENGYQDIEYMWNNGLSDNIKIKTDYGFEKEATPDHPIRVIDGEKIVWKEIKDIKLNDRVVIDRSTQWHSGSNALEPDEAYLLGLIVGDGGYTKRCGIYFTTADDELGNSIIKYSQKYFNKPFRKRNQKYTYCLNSVSIWDKLFSYYGFISPVCEHKTFPRILMNATKECMIGFIQGLFDTDGYASKNGQLEYCAKSKDLILHLQYILTKFGIISKVKPKLNKKYNQYYYYLYITGENARIFCREIGFRLSRKQDRLNKILLISENSNKDIIPKEFLFNRIVSIKNKYNLKINLYHLKIYDLTYKHLNKILTLCSNIKNDIDIDFLKDIYNKKYYFDKVVSISSSKNYTFDFHVPNGHSFISSGFISHNTTLLGVYSLLRALLLPNRKILLTGSVFRQSKLIFEGAEKIWNNAPLLRDICSGYQVVGPRKDSDMWRFYIADSTITAVPLGPDGESIRGLRANDILSDEFAATNKEVFEKVIAGFASVSSAPLDNVQKEAEKRWGNIINIQDTVEENEYIKPNQIVISGTADYEFNHFYSYWKRWKGIIESRGDWRKIKESIGNGEYDPGLNWKDYCIIRIPVDLIPKGFMDESQLSRAKATVHSGTFATEYGAVFSADSNGFFKRSLIDNCVVSKNPITMPSCGKVMFHPVTRGDITKKYVFGIDPASEVDNFAITILECHPDHRRIVYCWTINKKEQKEKIKQKLTEENDFYSYCCRKIRELMILFPCEAIAIDTQGGGRTVIERLSDPKFLKDGEQPIFPIIEDKYKDTDSNAGLHIIHEINFASADWTSESNHGLRRDLEDKILLFPAFDDLTYGLVAASDKLADRKYDTLESCVDNIEELKNELTSIICTKTATGRDRWDTPDTYAEGKMKKGKMRKDRYSALLMANSAGKKIFISQLMLMATTDGGFAHENTTDDIDIKGPLFTGPNIIVSQLENLY